MGRLWRAVMVLALAAGTSCGGDREGDDTPLPDAMTTTITRSPCDPAGPFPQVVGTVTFTNPNATDPVSVDLTSEDGVLSADPDFVEVPPGSSVTVTILAQSCPTEMASLDVVQTAQDNVLVRSRFRAVDADRSDALSAIEALALRLVVANVLALEWLFGLATSGRGGPTLHSLLAVLPKPPSTDPTEILLRGMLLMAVTRATLEGLFGAGNVAPAGNPPDFPCGAGPNGFTVCPTMPAPMPVEDYLFVWLATNGTIPLASPTRTYQYGFVFDADGNAANDYVPAPAVANDFYGGTDRWYSVEYDPVAGWRLIVTDARNNVFTVIPSGARAIIVDNAIGLFVPTSEFAVDFPAYRVTAFEHGGDFGIPPPNDWSGDLSPTVAEGLATYGEDD
jgi:hypothetical protein